MSKQDKDIIKDALDEAFEQGNPLEALEWLEEVKDDAIKTHAIRKITKAFEIRECEVCGGARHDYGIECGACQGYGKQTRQDREDSREYDRNLNEWHRAELEADRIAHEAYVQEMESRRDDW